MKNNFLLTAILLTTALSFGQTVYEAEDAVLSKVANAKEHPQFSGSGYADFGNAGSFIEFSNVKVEKADDYDLTIRYALSGSRPVEVIVNGESLGETFLSKNTKGFRNWIDETFPIKLKLGSNTIKIIAVGAGPNVDKISVVKK